MDNKLFDRELSWLSFNHRVLQEAKDLTVPLFERIKFLAIYSSNLDEFFRVRVASLRALLDLKKKSQKKLKFDPAVLLKQIHRKVFRQQEEFGEIFRNQIIPDLKKNKIFLIREHELNNEQAAFVTNYFNENIQPIIQPSIIEKKINLFLKNRAIYLAVRLTHSKKEKTQRSKSKYAILEIPSNTLPRFVQLPKVEDEQYLIFLDDIIRYNLKTVFKGYEVAEAYSIKLTRDAELYIDDEFTGNLLEKIKKSLSKRKTGVPSRFLYDGLMPKYFLKYLKECLDLDNEDMIVGGRYHNFHDFFSFPDFDKKDLKYKSLPPVNSKQLEQADSIFNAIRREDILLHYPYQKFDYIVELLREASSDPKVEAIQITLYRTAQNSEVVQNLIAAAKNGKEVTAFVEVKARFDEELNFQNGEEMEKAGIKVLYSFPGLKVHSKLCLITRKEDSGKKLYAYLASGNFNEKTSLIYSDLGLLTCDERLTKEAKKVLNILCRKSKQEDFEHLLVAPFNLRSNLNKLIETEIKNASDGKRAEITLKLNSIEDKKIIKKLYAASQAGVKVTIICRGICCLIPRQKKFSKNITVVSIVDRFLEHSRIFIFHNNGDKKYFISSADWMTRNLSRRIEVCFPIYDEKIKATLQQLINLQLRDNMKARRINRTQTNPYKRTRSVEKVRSQYATYDMLLKENIISPVSIKAV